MEPMIPVRDDLESVNRGAGLFRPTSFVPRETASASLTSHDPDGISAEVLVLWLSRLPQGARVTVTSAPGDPLALSVTWEETP